MFDSRCNSIMTYSAPNIKIPFWNQDVSVLSLPYENFWLLKNLSKSNCWLLETGKIKIWTILFRNLKFIKMEIFYPQILPKLNFFTVSKKNDLDFRHCIYLSSCKEILVLELCWKEGELWTQFQSKISTTWYEQTSIQCLTFRKLSRYKTTIAT